jgi:hypothetical protein
MARGANIKINSLPFLFGAIITIDKPIISAIKISINDDLKALDLSCNFLI